MAELRATRASSRSESPLRGTETTLRGRRAAPALAERHTSIEKALDVLAAFDGPYASRGLSELQRDLDLPRATLHRILRQLSDRGFLRQLPSKRYQIGLRLFELGSLVSDHVQVRTPAIPHLYELHHCLNQAVYLSVWTGEGLLHLDCLMPPHESPLPPRAVGPGTAHGASVGKVLLAHAPEADLARYLARPLKAVTRHTITDADALLRHLAQVRREGFATTIEESLIGVFGVAAPIKDNKGKVIAAICTAGHNRSLLRRREAVVQTADAISRDIAGTRFHGPTAGPRFIRV